MKTRTLKKSALYIALMLATLLCFIVAFAGKNVLPEKAIAENGTSDKLVIKDGAGVRLYEPAGLRFISTVTEHLIEEVETDENKTFGAFIVPDDYFARYGVNKSSGTDYVKAFTEAGLNIAEWSKEGLTVSDASDGVRYLACSLSGLFYKNYNRQYFGMFYVKTVNGENVSYEYASFNETENVRSIDLIAYRASLDREDNETLKTYAAKGYLLSQGAEYASAEQLETAAANLIASDAEYQNAVAYFRANEITGFTVNGYKYGEAAIMPTATAKYGEVTFTYSDSENGVFTDAIPVNAGTHYVKAQVAESKYYDGASQVKQFTIEKAGLAVKSLPTGKTLEFNAEEQELVTGGEIAGGSFVYKLPDGEWQPQIPTAVTAGTYTVYYKAVGDVNHNDGEEGSVTAVITVENGNVTYFNKAFGASAIGRTNGAAVSATQSVRFFGEEYSLAVVLQSPGYWPWIQIANPFVTDLNEKDADGNYLYDYLYFYVYTSDSGKTRVSPNINDAAAYSYLTEKVWKEFVMTRSGDTFTYNGIDVFGSKGEGGTVNNITGFYIDMNTVNETSWTTIYFSTIRAVKTLPAEINATMVASVWEGESVDLATATVTGETEVTQTVSVIKPDGTKEQVESASYVFASAGNYTFEYVVYAGGKFVGVKYLTVSAMQKDPGNITYWNKDFGVNTIGATNGNQGLSYDTSVKYGDEEGSLCVVTAAGAWGYIVISNPFITNLNEKDENGEYLYDYVYFYAYTEATKNRIGPNLTSYDGYSSGLFPSGEWTRILMTRSGETFKFNNIDVFGDQSRGTCTADDITNFYIGIDTSRESVSTTVYLSAMRAVKILPSE